MEEINTNNIINTGRRTRGKKIDYTNVNTGDVDDDDEEEDEDFVDPEQEESDNKMQH